MDYKSVCLPAYLYHGCMVYVLCVVCTRGAYVGQSHLGSTTVGIGSVVVYCSSRFYKFTCPCCDCSYYTCYCDHVNSIVAGYKTSDQLLCIAV